MLDQWAKNSKEIAQYGWESPSWEHVTHQLFSHLFLKRFIFSYLYLTLFRAITSRITLTWILTTDQIDLFKNYLYWDGDTWYHRTMSKLFVFNMYLPHPNCHELFYTFLYINSHELSTQLECAENYHIFYMWIIPFKFNLGLYLYE